MKIAHILPELHEGGVERHVVALANGQAAHGHELLVLSAGGRLEELLDGPRSIRLPVHRKNPITALYSALRIALLARREGIDLLHAHSRVPAWIAWWASSLSGVPWIATCHAYYSVNAGLTPYRRAKKLLCVSEGVRRFFAGIFPETPSCTIYNGLDAPACEWTPPSEGPVRFLFVGRLTEKKGAGVILKAFGNLSDLPWTLDIAGDGPAMDSLRTLASRAGIEERVTFLGFRDRPEELMARSSCFLFPSLQEGMGLTLMRAVQMRLPVLASDLPPVRELAFGGEGLLPPGDVAAWEGALRRFILGGGADAAFDPGRIPSVDEMVRRVENECYNVIGHLNTP